MSPVLPAQSEYLLYSTEWPSPRPPARPRSVRFKKGDRREREDETRGWEVGEPSSELHLEPTSLRVRCSLETTPSCESILAALAGGRSSHTSICHFRPDL